MFILGLFFLVFSVLFSFFSADIQFDLKEFFGILAISSVMSALFVLIRNSKPVFARFPIQFVYLPFVIIFFLPIVDDTLVIKNLVNMIYQGGTIGVALILIPASSITKKRKFTISSGTVVFLLSYLFKWAFLPEDLSKWVPELILIPAILISSYGFYKLPVGQNK